MEHGISSVTEATRCHNRSVFSVLQIAQSHQFDHAAVPSRSQLAGCVQSADCNAVDHSVQYREPASQWHDCPCERFTSSRSAVDELPVLRF